MAKGQVLKKEIAEKILATFPDSFFYNGDKEIRINGVEDGENLQIKVSLTCAKEAVTQGDDVALPGEVTIKTIDVKEKSIKTVVEPTAEEKANVAKLLEGLNF